MESQVAARRFVFALLLGSGAASSSAWAQAGCTPESIFDLFRASVKFQGGDAEFPQVATGLEIGDLNNDGWPDIVLSNDQSGDLSVILADGKEGFLPPVRLSLDSSNPFSLSGDVSLADVNNDNALDIIALASEVIAPRLFLNNGDGTFAPFTEIDVTPPSATLPVATDIVAADLDLDGNVDLVATRLFGGSIVAWGLGNGLFEPPVVFADLGNNRDVTIADFDADGLQDIGVDGTAILINQGTRSFAAPPQGPFINNPIDMTSAADLNGDGLLDIIFELQSNETGFAFATSPTTFGPPFFLPTPSLPDLVTAARGADIDGDGDIDLVGGGDQAGQRDQIGVALNNGDGTFQPIIYVDIDLSTTTIDVRAIRLVDIDRRGSPDAIVLRENGEFTVLRNTCLFRPVITQQPQAIAVGVGQPASFTATLAVELPHFTYQWVRDGVPLADGGGVSGATSPTLVLSNVTTEDIGLYTLEVVGDTGVAASTPAALAVVPSEGLVPGDFNGDGVADAADVLDLVNEIEN
jgi:hypothetical protein